MSNSPSFSPKISILSIVQSPYQLYFYLQDIYIGKIYIYWKRVFCWRWRQDSLPKERENGWNPFQDFWNIKQIGRFPFHCFPLFIFHFFAFFWSSLTAPIFVVVIYSIFPPLHSPLRRPFLSILPALVYSPVFRKNSGQLKSGSFPRFDVYIFISFPFCCFVPVVYALHPFFTPSPLSLGFPDHAQSVSEDIYVLWPHIPLRRERHLPRP